MDLLGKKGGRVDRLLILSCSQRKAPAKGRLPAIDRYDGPAFRVLRKYLREGPAEVPTVLILSAKYGLIESEREDPVVRPPPLEGFSSQTAAAGAEDGEACPPVAPVAGGWPLRGQGVPISPQRARRTHPGGRPA